MGTPNDDWCDEPEDRSRPCYWDGPRPCSHDRGAALPKRVAPFPSWRYEVEQRGAVVVQAPSTSPWRKFDKPERKPRRPLRDQLTANQLAVLRSYRKHRGNTEAMRGELLLSREQLRKSIWRLRERRLIPKEGEVGKAKAAPPRRTKAVAPHPAARVEAAPGAVFASV